MSVRIVNNVVARFKQAAEKNVAPEHVSICVAAFRVGVECGVREDVKDSEMDALEALVIAISRGFETGLRVRREQSDAGVTDAGEIG